MTNTSDDCAANVLTEHPSAKLYVYPTLALGIVIMVLNALVMAAVIKNKRLHKPAMYFVCSLAVADFIAALTLVYSFLRNFLNREKVVTKEEVIKQGVFVTSIAASMLSLLVIAFNRFFVIIHPFNYRAKMNNTVVILVMIAIWVCSLIFGALPVAGWNADNGDCSRIFPGLARTYVFVLSLHVIVVLLVIFGLYMAIYVRVRKSTFTRDAYNKDQKAHVKVAKTLFIVTAAFAVCWLPIMTIGLLDMARSITLAKYTPFFVVLAVFNSLLNPLIYAYCDKEMKNTFGRILCGPWDCCQRQREPIDDDSSTWLTACFTGSSFDKERDGNDARGGNNQPRQGNYQADNEARGIDEKPFMQ